MRAVSFLLVTMVLACGLRASSVIQVSIQEIVVNSDFVFEGTVIRQQSVRPEGSNNIFTRVTFLVSEVIKGDPNASTVSLYFMGGTIGALTLSISDMDIPPDGERGIYFVESVASRQVHPLYGWNQGRFLILNDRDGNPHVYTAQGKPVNSIGETSAPAKAMVLEGKGAVAGGVMAGSTDGSLTLDAFKQRVREIGDLR